MEIAKSIENNILKIALSGRLDTNTAPELETVISEEIGGKDLLEIDFKKLDYISSAGLRVLLSAQKIMNKQGKMVLKNVNETVMEIFEITGFSDILNIE